MTDDVTMAEPFERVPQPVPSTPAAPNFFDQFDGEADAARPSAGDRFVSNLRDGYSNSLMGAAGTAAGGYVEDNALHLIEASRKGAERMNNTSPEPMEGEDKLEAYFRSRAAQRRQRDGVVVQSFEERRAEMRGEMTRYEAMPSWSGPLEGLVALGGQLFGSLPSPENLITSIPGAGAIAGKVASSGLGKAVVTGAVSQGVVSAATDPAVQALKMEGNVQASYDYMQTAFAAPLGALLGGALGGVQHGLSRLIAGRHGVDAAAVPKALEAERLDIAVDDPSVRRPTDVPAVRPIETTATEAPVAPVRETDARKSDDGLPEIFRHSVKTIDELYSLAPKAQAELSSIGRELEVALGTKFIDPGLKDRAGAESKIIRKDYDDASEMTDVVRGAFVMNTPDDAARIISELGSRFSVLDEGWVTTLAGYTDRKLLIRSTDGVVAEVQLLHPDMMAAKKERGHALYEEWRALPAGDSRRPDLEQQMRELYSAAAARLSEDWKAEIGSGGKAPNRLAKSSSEIVAADTKTSPSSTLRQAPLKKDQASPDAQKVGRPSQTQDFMETSSKDTSGYDVTSAKSTDGEVKFRERDTSAGDSLPPDRPAATEVGDAAPVETPELRSLQQQAQTLAEAIGMPLRQGRLSKSSALGQFSEASGVSRVRSIADVETVAHEAGHHIETKIGVPLKTLLSEYRTNLAPFDYDATRGDPSEGFAEFLRKTMIGQPVPAELAAFNGQFRALMEKHDPLTLDALDNAAVAYRTWLNAPSGQKIDAMVVGSHGEGVTAFYREHGMYATIKTGISMVFRQVIDPWSPESKAVRSMTRVLIGRSVAETYRQGIDRNSPVTQAVASLTRAMREKSGALVDLKHADNPDVLLRLAARSHQTALRNMLDGVRGYASLDIAGPSLHDALAVATGQPSLFGKWDAPKLKEFNNYLVARRSDHLYAKFEAGDLPNRPIALTKGDVLKVIAEAEAANPTFREASEMVHGYTRGLLQKQFDAGILERDLFDRLIAEPFYVPMFRDVRDKPMAGGGGATGKVPDPGLVDTVKTLRGSDRDVILPIQNLMKQTFMVERQIAHNDAVKAMVLMARQAGPAAGRIVEEVPSHQLLPKKFSFMEGLKSLSREHSIDPDDARLLASSVADLFGDNPEATIFRREVAGKRGEPIVFWREGGELKAVRFMADKEGLALYEAFATMPPAISDVIVKLIGASTTVLRTGITAHPTFAITNWIRDQLTVATLRSDFAPFWTGLKGTAKELAQSDSAKLYAWAGGVTPGASVGSVDKAIEGSINALAKKGYLITRLNSLHGWLELAGATETGTRIGVFDAVYKREMKRGRSQYEAVLAATAEATDMMDFSRRGEGVATFTHMIPFINAGLQGIDKMRRVMVDPFFNKAIGNINTVAESEAVRNAVLAWGKTLFLFPPIGFLLAHVQRDSSAYNDAEAKLKATHFVIGTGDGKAIVIPKPFEVGVGFNIGEEAYARFMRDDPRSAHRMGEALFENFVSPFNPYRWLTGVPIIKTTFELSMNRSEFTKRDIVPKDMERLPAEWQYTDRTAPYAKRIGELTGWSPMKIEHAVGSLFGLYGRDLAAASHMFATVTEEKASPGSDRTIFMRRFVKNEMTATDTTRVFWENIAAQTGKLPAARAAYDRLMGQFQDTEAREFLSKLKSVERAYVVMAVSINPDTGKASFTADDRRLHPLTRASEAARLLGGLANELQNARTITWSTGERMARIDPDTLGRLRDQVNILRMVEMRNGLTITEADGYKGRALVDPSDQLDVIRVIHPGVADEIVSRYARQKIVPTHQIARVWPEMLRRLSADGSRAEVAELRFDATSDGYEFGGIREKKAPKRRGAIEGVKK